MKHEKNKGKRKAFIYNIYIYICNIFNNKKNKIKNKIKNNNQRKNNINIYNTKQINYSSLSSSSLPFFFLHSSHFPQLQAFLVFFFWSVFDGLQFFFLLFSFSSPSSG